MCLWHMCISVFVYTCSLCMQFHSFGIRRGKLDFLTGGDTDHDQYTRTAKYMFSGRMESVTSS